jgi:lysozyme
MVDKALEQAADFVAPFEGYRATEYVCPGGVLTFGYGSLLRNYPDVELPVTPYKARQYLISDLEKALKTIDELVTARLNINQTVALMSFVHNVGSGAFAKSTLLRYLNLGAYEAAANEFPRWNKSKGAVLQGLVRRREAERALFLTPVENAFKDLTHLDFLHEKMSFDGIVGYFQASVYQNLFNIGKSGTRQEWEVSLVKAQHYLDELKKLVQKL